MNEGTKFLDMISVAMVEEEKTRHFAVKNIMPQEEVYYLDIFDRMRLTGAVAAYLTLSIKDSELLYSEYMAIS